MAANLNIECYKGDDVAKVLKFRASDRTTAIDLTGYTFAALALNTDGTTAATFSVTCPSPTSGNVTVSLNDATTTSLGAGSWKWSMTQTVSNVTTTILVGTFTVLEVA